MVWPFQGLQSNVERAGQCYFSFARPLTAQANIKESRYGIDFFKGFEAVLNGLDNMEARRHVNRLCLAAGTPLVESGTEGYLGQVCTSGP